MNLPARKPTNQVQNVQVIKKKYSVPPTTKVKRQFAANDTDYYKKETALPSNTKRSTSADRSHLHKTLHLETTDPRMSGRVTIDQKFARSYGEQGLQPSYKQQVDRTRGARIERVDRTQAPDMRVQLYGDWSQEPKRVTQVERKQQAEQEGKVKQRIATQLRKRRVQLAGRVLISVILTTYPVQLALAILNIMFFGLAYVYLEFVSIGTGLEGETVLDVIIRTATGIAIQFADTLSKAIELITGIDFGVIINALLPDHVYAFTLFALLFFGATSLALVSATFKMLGIPTFGGWNIVDKVLILTVCVMGYFIPIMNLVPWALVWTMYLMRSKE